jgi:glycosyltransferase involved in cell wall biosynthesis
VPAPSTSTPLVSVLVPTFDYGRFLDEAVASVLAQTVTDLEVVIVDNASGDNTPEVAWTHALADRRVRYVRNQTNIGGLANWDRALALARGEYVKYLFADDVLVPHAVETLLAPLVDDPGITFSFSHWGRFDAEGTAYPALPYVADRPCVLDGRSLVANALCRVDNVLGCPSSVLFRRRDLAGAPGFARLMREPVHVDSIADFIVFAELAGRGWCAYTPEDLTFLRQHGSSWTAGANQSLRFHIDWPRAFRYLSTQGLTIDRRVARTFVATLAGQIAPALTSPGPVVEGLAGLLGDLGAILAEAGDAPAVPTDRVHLPVLAVVESSGTDATAATVAAIVGSTHRRLVEVAVVAPADRRTDLVRALGTPVRFLAAGGATDTNERAAASGLHDVVVALPDTVTVPLGFAEDLLAQARSGLSELQGPPGSRARRVCG